MNLALLLHIYQPPIQERKKVEEILNSSYLPLLKLLKSKSDLKLTMNIPLSLSYFFQLLESQETIELIRELLKAEKIELTSTGAYHPLLTKIPLDFVEKEIVLNERGLGYYYGMDKGFEGEEALVIKNVNGFFPPEGAINQTLVEKLNELGYLWVFADEVALPQQLHNKGYHPVYELKDMDVKLVVRHKGLSDMLSFSRSTDVIEGLIENILSFRQEGVDLVLALDGEFFGHHFDEGIYLLETLASDLTSLGVNLTTVEELIEESDFKTLDKADIIESTWAASFEEISKGATYPMWDIPGNDLQKTLWEIQSKVLEAASADSLKDLGKFKDIFETFPLWDFARLSKVEDVTAKNEIFKNILLLQSLHSDQFWWASNVQLKDKKIYHQGFIKKALELYKQYAAVVQNKELADYLEKKGQEIESVL